MPKAITYCTYDGLEGRCFTRVKSHELCSKHLSRWERYGTTELTTDVKSKRRPDTYLAAHGRLHRARGPASAHNCVDCRKPAQEWSLKKSATDVKNDPINGKPFSDNFDDYEPRCTPCHRKYDGRPSKDGRTVSNELVAYIYTSDVPATEIVREYGISYATVSNIRTDKIRTTITRDLTKPARYRRPREV